MLFNYWYILAIGLFQVLSAASFSPPGREAAATSLVGNNFVVFGGDVHQDGPGQPSSAYSVTNNIFFLDVSNSWSTQSPLWTDHTTDAVNANLAPHRYWATMTPGKDAVSLWIYGGTDEPGVDFTTQPKFAVYNTASNSWSDPTVSNQSIPILTSHTAVVNNAGVIFFFGGQMQNATSWTGAFDAIGTLDTSSGVWNTLPLGNGPTGVIAHTATMVK